MPLHPCTDACRFAQAEERIAELEACLQEIRTICINPDDTGHEVARKVGDLLDAAQPRFLLAERASKQFQQGYTKGRDDGWHSGLQDGMQMAFEQAAQFMEDADLHEPLTPIQYGEIIRNMMYREL